MSEPDETWQRITAANAAAGVDIEWSVAERDQMEALADDMNRELDCHPVIHAWRSKNGTELKFWCKFCNTHHTHGRHGGQGHVDAEHGWVARIDAVLPLRLWKRYLQRFADCRYDLWSPVRRSAACTCPTGSGDGHRAPHCGNRTGEYYKRGYILHEVEPNDLRATRKPERARS